MIISELHLSSAMSGVGGSLAPVIVNSEVVGHPVVQQLGALGCFKLVTSGHTQPASLQFPTLRCSCLLLSPDTDTTTAVETCHTFASLNLNPFVLLCSAVPASAEQVILAASQLTVSLAAASPDRRVEVVPGWDTDQATTSLLFLLRTSAQRRPPPVQEVQVQTSELRARLTAWAAEKLTQMSEEELQTWLKHDQEFVDDGMT